MREFIELVFKELKGDRSIPFAFFGLVISFFLLSILMREINLDTIYNASLFILTLFFGALPLLYFLAGYDLFKREWKDGTIALWSAVPVKPWKLVGSKITAVFTEFLFIGILISTAIVVLVWPHASHRAEFGEVFMQTVLIFLQSHLILLPLAAIAAALYMSGTIFSKYGGLMRLVSGFALLWVIFIVDRLVDIGNVSLVYAEVPYLESVQIGGGTFSVAFPESISLSLVLILYLTGVLSFILGGKLLGRRVLP